MLVESIRVTSTVYDTDWS